jgi:predicted lipoprotein with Yx(FWY)xxD motif
MLALVAVAGAASSSAAPRAGQQADDAQASATLTVRSSRFGRILFDGRGRALYAFTRDRRGRRSRCYGACAKAWPVYFAKGRALAGKGVRQSLIGATRRRDGRRQVTYNGRPLYYYVGDKSPRPDPVPERRRVRRHLAGRTAEWAARSIADPFASRAEAVGHGEGPATQAPALLRTERPSPG